MPVHLKLFQKIAEEGTLQRSFYLATITLIAKPGRETHTKWQANITEEHKFKNSE